MNYNIMNSNEQFIYISNNTIDINKNTNINTNTNIYKYIILLNFDDIIDDLKKSFKNKNDILNQFKIDVERSKIYINSKKSNYKYLKKYIKTYISPLYYYDYLICFSQALLAIPYIILTNSIKSTYFVGELNYKQRELISKYINIKIINNSIKIYKYLRVFTINENDIDKTLYIIKITISIDLCKTPENIYINFKICKLKNIINKLTI